MIISLISTHIERKKNGGSEFFREELIKVKHL